MVHSEKWVYINESNPIHNKTKQKYLQVVLWSSKTDQCPYKRKHQFGITDSIFSKLVFKHA